MKQIYTLHTARLPGAATITEHIFHISFSDYKEYNTDTNVNFKVTMAEEELVAIQNQGLMKKFNLTSSINLSNMVS